MSTKSGDKKMEKKTKSLDSATAQTFQVEEKRERREKKNCLTKKERKVACPTSETP